MFFLRAIFAFTPNLVMCTVKDNVEVFIFPTYSIGELPIEPHEFFMYMTNRGIVEEVTFDSVDGRKRVILNGQLNCNAAAATVSSRFGDRDICEPASFIAEAVDGRSFRLTAIFDGEKVKLNHVIFGPRYRFEGRISAGRIVVTELGKILGLFKSL